MESWRQVWREGFVPVLSLRALVALRDALRDDSLHVIQGHTTVPPAHHIITADMPVEAACAIGFCGWQGEDLHTVHEVTHYFDSVCHEANLNLRHPTAAHQFLDWFDETARAEVLAGLLPEVERAIAEKTPTIPLPVLPVPTCLLAAV